MPTFAGVAMGHTSDGSLTCRLQNFDGVACLALAGEINTDNALVLKAHLRMAGKSQTDTIVLVTCPQESGPAKMRLASVASPHRVAINRISGAKTCPGKSRIHGGCMGLSPPRDRL